MFTCKGALFTGSLERASCKFNILWAWDHMCQGPHVGQGPCGPEPTLAKTCTNWLGPTWARADPPPKKHTAERPAQFYV